MDFTREPVIETVITPKEGCKLAVRNSKGAGQEEYFVDAVEIVSYGNAYFYRSLERPKSFFVPVSDYEVLEVRETRMVLKNVGMDRTIKIGSTKDQNQHQHRQLPKEPQQEKVQPLEVAAAEADVVPIEPRVDRKRERRRQMRRRRGKDETREVPVSEAPQEDFDGEETAPASTFSEDVQLNQAKEERKPFPATPHLILEPPKTLISETISRYRENGLYQEAFFERAAKDAHHDKEEGCSDESMTCEGDDASLAHKEDAGKNAGFPYQPWENAELDEQRVGQVHQDAEQLKSENEVEDPYHKNKENTQIQLTQDSIEP